MLHGKPTGCFVLTPKEQNDGRNGDPIAAICGGEECLAFTHGS